MKTSIFQRHYLKNHQRQMEEQGETLLKDDPLDTVIS